MTSIRTGNIDASLERGHLKLSIYVLFLAIKRFLTLKIKTLRDPSFFNIFKNPRAKGTMLIFSLNTIIFNQTFTHINVILIYKIINIYLF